MVPTKEEMETENTDQIFMDKVNKILEKNLSTDKYTIDIIFRRIPGYLSYPAIKSSTAHSNR